MNVGVSHEHMGVSRNECYRNDNSLNFNNTPDHARHIKHSLRNFFLIILQG
jgi:hypothetical protein